MKSRINEREINQRMMKVIRESAQMQHPEAAPLDNKGSKPAITPPEQDIAEEQAKFRRISNDAQFTEYAILPDEQNIIFSGYIPGLCEFVFELSQQEGFAIRIPELATMTPRKLEIIKDMGGYYENWRTEMWDKLREYQQDSND
jgi:hypothetical protein